MHEFAGFLQLFVCERSRRWFSRGNVAIPVILGSFSTLVGVALAGIGLFWMLKKRYTRLMKVKYFEQNGGIQLQNYIASKGERESARIFSAEEIKKATSNFSDDMKLGSGGFGAVYKGDLSDGTLVAIKKSIKEVHDQQDEDQFINEVIILTQINHRNVVKLLGCCLETQSPLLVYEYVPNGTLSDHLHGNLHENSFLSWESRLRIDIETAEALAYLHSGVHTPVIHRDRGRLAEILDPKIAILGDEQDMKSMEYVGKLAKKCLQSEGERRPSMKEVVEELVWIRGATGGRRAPGHGDSHRMSTQMECHHDGVGNEGYETSALILSTQRSDKYVEKGEAEAYPCGEFVSEGPSTRTQTYTTGVQLVNMSGR
eukprot:Gb_23402 [translate_table: standard]